MVAGYAVGGGNVLQMVCDITVRVCCQAGTSSSRLGVGPHVACVPGKNEGELPIFVIYASYCKAFVLVKAAYVMPPTMCLPD